MSANTDDDFVVEDEIHGDQPCESDEEAPLSSYKADKDRSGSSTGSNDVQILSDNHEKVKTYVFYLCT